MDAELMQHLEAMESRLNDRIDVMESRLNVGIDAMESRLNDRIVQTVGQSETKLLTAFHRWSRSMEIRVRNSSHSVEGFDERLALAEERISELERKRACAILRKRSGSDARLGVARRYAPD